MKILNHHYLLLLELDIRIGSFEIVELLLKYLKQAHLRFKNKNTPLHVAAMFGQTYLVRYFISLKFNVNAKNINEETPLHLAAWCTPERYYNLLDGNEQITVSKTWNKFTDLKCIEKECNSCAAFCTCCEHYCLVNTLKQKQFNDSIDENDNTITYNPYEEIVEILLENNAKVNLRSKDGLLPIHVAADRNKNYLIVEKLLNAKVYLNGRDKTNHTPLFIAACNNCPKVVEILLKYSVNIHYLYDENLDTILHKTCENRNLHISHMLIKKTSDTSARNTFGNTPLHLAIQYQFLAITKILVLYRKNLQLNFKNKVGQTPMDIILYNYKDYDVNILQKFFNILLKYGANPERRNQNNQTVLHICVEKNVHSKNLDDIAKIANVDIQDNNGFTALHLVVQKKALYSVNYNIQGFIQYNNSSNFVECRNYLLSLLREGANLNIKDNNNNSSFEIFYKLIIKNEKREIIEYMLPVIKIFFEHIKKLQVIRYYIDKNILECNKLLENTLSKYKYNMAFG